jgi:hypothetical protein
MSEEPIKLFASRSEQYPMPTEADAIQGGARVVLAAIPGIGGPITEVLSMVLAPAVTRRRDVWFRELAEALDQLQSKVEGFRVEDLVDNEVFISTVIQATRAASATHQQEKREFLRNVLLKVAIGKGPAEELQQVFISAIEAFTVSHIKVLNVLWNAARDLTDKGLWSAASPHGIHDYGKAIKVLHPELANQDNLLRYIMADLHNWGLTNLSKPDDAFPQGGSQAITNMGVEFLRFVLDPVGQNK